MVFHLGRYVLVVRMRALKRRLIRMGLRVVPEELLGPSTDFVAVSVDQSGKAVEDQAFPDHQAKVSLEMDFSRHPRESSSLPHTDERRMANRRKALDERVDEELVVFERAKWVIRQRG